VSETGPIPDTGDCHRCRTAIIWLWSPRVHRGLGGWVKFERVTADGMTIRSHRCAPPRGEFDYQGSEEIP
jgi:hypothetical protein